MRKLQKIIKIFTKFRTFQTNPFWVRDHARRCVWNAWYTLACLFNSFVTYLRQASKAVTQHWQIACIAEITFTPRKLTNLYRWTKRREFPDRKAKTYWSFTVQKGSRLKCSTWRLTGCKETHAKSFSLCVNEKEIFPSPINTLLHGVVFCL